MQWSLAEYKLAVWQVDLGAAWSYDACSALLHADELLRAQRLRVPAKRLRFVLGRAAVKMILSLYLQCAPAQLEFSYNAYGKPYIAGISWGFNLSHSGDTMLVVLGLNPNLGVDLEMRRSADNIKLATKLCHPLEYTLFQNCPGPSQLTILYDLWSLKEAVIKAQGGVCNLVTCKSLCLIQDMLAQDHDANYNSCILADQSVWYFKMVALAGYSAAIASAKQFSYDRVWHLTPAGVY